MNSLTELIRNEIRLQYKSMRKFCDASGIPYSTLSNALSKGLGGTSYETVVKICRQLNLKQTLDSDIVLFNSQFHDIYQKLNALDEQGLHTVRTVLDVEYARCSQDDAPATVRGFQGYGYQRLDSEHLDTERIKFLVRKVLEDG